MKIFTDIFKFSIFLIYNGFPDNFYELELRK
jgi:hypothetical protein